MRFINKSRFCESCNRETGSMYTWLEHFLFILLLLLLIIPGVIYWKTNKGNICGLCKMKYKTSKKNAKKLQKA